MIMVAMFDVFRQSLEDYHEGEQCTTYFLGL